MMRPTVLRNAARVPPRPLVPSRAAFHAHAPARVTPVKTKTGRHAFAFRTYSSENMGGGAAGQGVVLGALALIAIGGYFYIKPIRDVASKINNTMEAAQETVEQAKSKAKEATSKAKDVVEKAGEQVDLPVSPGDAFDGVLESLLPGGAFVLYQQFSDQIKSGDFGGILSKLKDADMQSTLKSLKKLGNDDVNSVVDKVQAALDKAGGKVGNVDWKKLSQDLTKELPEEYQKWVKVLVGKVPTMDDFDKYVADVKKLGEKRLADLNKAAEKVYHKVEKASKDGKSVGDAFVEGIKETAPEDINKLVDQIRKTAKEAGLPADTIEGYIRATAVDSIDSAEEWARQVEVALVTTAKWIPVDVETVVDQVSSVSPPLGKLFDEVLKDAKKKADEGKTATEDIAAKAKDIAKGK
ncbi:hypothetical protein CcaverHIS002_0701970 [Cutaneotrichosporon cavernicola]|nr:hypothetical protein CcaverHIS002_0701970 [Cutaneotrichosporon cavernicola]